MDTLFDLPLVQIIEDNNLITYRKMMVHNIPTYFPPKDKFDTPREFCIDSAMLLPITKDDFYHDRDHKFIGFRYCFINAGHDTVSLGPDPQKLGWTHAQLTFSIHRVRFYVVDGPENEPHIIFDRTFDSIFPPRTIDIRVPSSKFGNIMQDIVMDTIGDMNQYYLEHRV